MPRFCLTEVRYRFNRRGQDLKPLDMKPFVAHVFEADFAPGHQIHSGAERLGIAESWELPKIFLGHCKKGKT